MDKLTEQEVLKGFSEGLDCSQQVLASVSEELKITKEDGYKVASAFGAGMGHADTCGCVTGALMALGLKYGHSKSNDVETKERLIQKKQEFEAEFKKQHKSCICREILGADLTTPDGMKQIQENKLLETICPKLVVSSSQILKRLLSEKGSR